MTKENKKPPEQSEKKEESLHIMQRYFHWPLTNTILAIIGLTGIGITGYKWAQNEIVTMLEKKLSDPKILRQIAAESRPMLIFDSKESIVADMGASSLVKNISVVPYKTGSKLPATINIDFAIHLPTAPILTPLNSDANIIQPQRGKGHSWTYNLSYGIYLEPASNIRSYRLEIIR